jgi:hypothetical protein
MKPRCFALIAFLYFMSSHAYGQGLSGKWETNLAAAPGAVQALPAQRKEGRAVVLDLAVETDNKLAGTVREIGSGVPLTITDGTITGKTFTFTTKRTANGSTFIETWNGEMTDDNTLRVTQTRSSQLTGAVRGRGGFGGIVPVDPAPRSSRTTGDLILHRAQSTTPLVK